MLGEGTGLKILAGGLTGGVVLALLEGVTPAPPDATAMMYSLAVAVIGLAGLAFQNRRSITERPVEKVSNTTLLDKLEDFAYGPRGMFIRIDKIDEKIETLSGKIDTASLRIENHGARLDNVERQCSEERLRHHAPHNAAGFGG
jgi:hypothetical protein